MRIQISPTKRVKDALVVWHKDGPEVDIVLDSRPPYGLTFRPGTVKVIYACGILGLTKAEDLVKMVTNFYHILAPGGELYIVEHDFDYICRAYVGGDIPLNEFNRGFLRVTNLNQAEISKILVNSGFPEKDQKVWYEGMNFVKQHYEIIISAKKTNAK